MLTSRSTPSVFAEHPCGNHVNVQKDSVPFCRASMWQPCERPERLRPFLQSIHVATMLTSRKTPSVFAEHPCGNHVNVQKDSVPFCRASMWQPCERPERLRPFLQSIHVATMITSTTTPSAHVAAVITTLPEEAKLRPWSWAYAFQWRHNVCLKSSVEEALPRALWR